MARAIRSDINWNFNLLLNLSDVHPSTESEGIQRIKHSNADTSEATTTLTPEDGYHLTENKATGLDKIPGKLQRNCTSSGCSSFSILFDTSFSQG